MTSTHEPRQLLAAILHLNAAANQYRNGDLGALHDALTNLTGARTLMDEAEEATVRAMRHQRGTWQEIGDALGVTRSAAQQRFRHIEP